jgi:hypothetical protein
MMSTYVPGAACSARRSLDLRTEVSVALKLHMHVSVEKGYIFIYSSRCPLMIRANFKSELISQKSVNGCT